MTATELLTLISAALLLQVVAGIGWTIWRKHATDAGASPLTPTAAPQKSEVAWAGWRDFRVAQRVFEDEARSQCSFYLRPVDGQPLPPFKPGQFLTFALDVAPRPSEGPAALRTITRCYSLSDRPDPVHYRVTIKRVPALAPEFAPGLSSNHFHDHVQVGDVLRVKAPAGHFFIDPDPDVPVVLIGGGIGITPMLTMAHRLHTLGRDFRLHYLARGTAPFAAEIAAAPWAGQAQTHLKTTGPRTDMAALIPPYQPGARLYTCGGAGFMDAVFATAQAQGWPEDALAREYFATPEAPEYVNHPFTLHLARSGRDIAVPADLSGTEALAAAGLVIATKCSDGICGVCAVAHQSPDGIEHRDYVLSAKERTGKIILCCSRAREPGGRITLDL